MNRVQKWLNKILWILIAILGFYIIYRGLGIAGENGYFQKIPLLRGLKKQLEEAAVDTYLTGFGYAKEETSSRAEWLPFLIGEALPVYTFAEEEIENRTEIESRLEYELLVEAEEEMQKMAKETELQTEGKETETETTQTEEPKQAKQTENENREPVQEVDMAALQDFNTLVNEFFVADPSTTAESSELNVDAFMAKDLKLANDNAAPQILIYHTHSQEAFADSIEGDPNTSIVGVGAYLAEVLQDTYGYHVIHHTKVYDMIDGQLDRNMAYTLAAPDIQQILDENPSIEVVIDLHRDGVEHHFVTDINGKPTAKIMFFNGLSRTARNGPVDYLPNPNIEDNLAFSFQLSLKARQYYPDFIRCIYLQSLRYNLHLRPRALLIESGTHLNTFQEQLNAMEPLADILNQVLRGE